MIAAEALPRLKTALAMAYEHVQTGQDMALIVLGNEAYDVLETLVSLDYWTDGNARYRFEKLAGQAARTCAANRAVLVTNMLDEDEPFLWIASIDLDNGLDLARQNYTRNCCTVQYGEVEVLTGRAGLAPNSPGALLLRHMLVHNPVSD